jgi:nucleoside-diphosphate-sugar epimerase
VRPSYFMQNLTTTFLEELRSTHSLTLPAGNGRVNWIDVHDVGRACAVLLLSFDQHTNQAFEITGSETKSFPEVLQILNAIVGTQMVYHSINPISFYFRRRTNLSHEFAVVITMLHFLPRIQPEPQISIHYQQLTRQSPSTLASFFAREKQLFL